MALIAEHQPLRWLLDGSSPSADSPRAAPAPRPPAARPAEPMALPQSTLSAVVGSGLAADRGQWQAAPDAAPELMACVYAVTVPGLPPGLHEWADGFRLLDGQPDPGFTLRYGTADAFVLVCANIAAACESPGTRGYGHALIRAGAIGHRILLAAAACGIGARACPESFYPTVRALERARGDMWRHLFTVALTGLDRAPADRAPEDADGRGATP